MITYYFKLYNSKRNKKLHRSIDAAGRIYNHLIALHKRYYRLYGRFLNLYKLMKHITKLKKTKRFAYWNNLNAQAIQDIAERIDRNHILFFKNRNNGIKSSPPSFKKIAKYKSFTLKQSGYKLLEGKEVYPEYDVQLTDKYGRTLAYVWLKDGTLFNELLLLEGFTQVATFLPNVKYVVQSLSRKV